MVPLSITLFGPLSVLVGGEPIPHLRSRKAQWLLCLLTLRHGRPVQREWLAGTLWPDVDQAQAFANLRPALSELRKALGSEGERLQSPNRNSLLLDLTGAEVDVLRFDAALSSKTTASLERLDDAVEMYRGPLLEGCAEEWVVADRETREQACLRALETLATAAAADGNPDGAADYWRRASTLAPLSEVPRRGLMEALTNSGDSNAALQVYREFLALLRRDDPQATPDDETIALYGRLRSEARKRADTARLLAAEADVAPVVSGYLPHALTNLVGREDERLDVAQRLRQSRLLTLTGPGGIGKTRLAAAVAHEVVREYADGVWLIPLDILAAGGGHCVTSSASDPARERTTDAAIVSIVQQIASVLGVKGRSDRPLLSAVTGHLKRKRSLLVLDNCEHLVEPCATVVSRLLRECAGVRVLATSRETLRVIGEAVWPVPALAAPDAEHISAGGTALARALQGYDAVQLFVDRAEAVHKSFTLSGSNARDVALLCARLEGVPLAIELAAARVGVLTPAEILAQLDAHPLDALASRKRDVVPRHRSLRATLAWSYGLLPPEAQTFLAGMSVFRGGWTLAEAAAVCPEADTPEMLTVLQDASLINMAEEDGKRFSLLETVRQFTVEVLETFGRAGELQRRHARYFGEWITERSPESDGSRFYSLVQAGYANVLAALSWALNAGDEELAVQFCHRLTVYWVHTGRTVEARHWLDTTLRRVSKPAGSNSESFSTHQERLLYVQSWFLYHEADFEAAAEPFIAIYHDHCRKGTPVAGRTALYNGAVCLGRSDAHRSLAMLEECLPLERSVSLDGRANPVILSSLVDAYCAVGNDEQVAIYLAEALDLCQGREESDPNACMTAYLCAGKTALDQGELVLAQDYMEKMIEMARRNLAKGREAHATCVLVKLAVMSGEYERAGHLLAEAIELMGPEPAMIELQHLRFVEADFLLATGKAGDAAALARDTLSLLCGKARANRTNVHPLLLLVIEADLTVGEQKRGAAERAARLFGAAGGMAARCGLSVGRTDRERIARVCAMLAARVGPERMAEEEAIGAALDDEAALELAVETS